METRVAPPSQNLPEYDQLASSIAIVVIDYTHSHTVEVVLAPRPQKHPSVRTTFFELKAELLVCFHPLNDLIQKAWKHSIENDSLKQIKNQRCDKESTHLFRRKYGTNQNFIDQATLTFTRLAVKTNRSHRRSTNS